jgi:hypothetical protein
MSEVSSTAVSGVTREINRVMNDNRFHPGLHRQWSIVRNELNQLAVAFDLGRLRWD